MSLHARVLTLCLVLAAVPARAEEVEIGASVVKVSGDGAKRRVTIDKGKKAGLKLGMTGELYPRRASEGSPVIAVDFNVRVAVGKIVELEDDSAVLSLDAVADTIEKDQFITFDVDVPAALAGSPLFRVTAIAVELRPQGADHPYITVEQMLADPSQALQDKTLDLMIKDLKDMKATIVSFMKDRIEGGTFHGKTAAEVIDALDRAQLRDFLIFVEAFPGKYLGHHWNLPEVYFTWVISGTPSGEKELSERAVRSTAKAAAAATVAGKLDEARALWEKALKTAPDYKDAATYFLPFDALVTSAAGEPVRYAVEDYRISIQTATTLEHLLEPQRDKSAGTMLAISNPDRTLPGAQKEVARIVKSAVPDAHVLVKKEATLKKFQELAGGFRYIHLATHGILDPDPRKSYLKLADGPLTVQQISQLQGLDQSNELVVLSACDTANEEGRSTGDELISLAVAFAMAGSPTLVASLWEVGDDSTAELMATFYRALTQNTGDRLEALRAAKLNLLRTERGNDKPFAPPWHWASFQMYGDFRGAAK